MTALAVFAVILGVLGIIGSVVPGLPGPPLSWLGLLLLRFYGGVGNTLLFVWLGITLLITVLDYVLPAVFTRWGGGSKAGTAGAIIGLIAGIFLTPVGMIWGSLLGAFIGEYVVSRNSVGGSLKAAVAAFFGFLFTTGVKLICSAVMLYYIIAGIV
ncbi:MAG: DUF456 domain-containing protein [Bacteroidales bacterium]|nr:DUF456 domain-containing protein [Bacteroidales bacterium]